MKRGDITPIQFDRNCLFFVADVDVHGCLIPIRFIWIPPSKKKKKDKSAMTSSTTAAVRLSLEYFLSPI